MHTPPEQLVEQFFTEYSQKGAHDSELIARLTKLALSQNEAIAETATRAIFASLVERLADSFEPGAARLYNRVFAQIIQLCRSDSRAATLDRELTGFGLLNEEDLLGRAEGLSRVPRIVASDLEHSLKRVIVLSRVTLGADVAITSVILERIKLLYPSAELVLVGGKKTSELFGGDRRLQFKHIDYRRGGTLIERLRTWIDLLSSVRELTLRLGDGEFLVIDPDTRLTQLGLLPVTKIGDRGQGTGDRGQGTANGVQSSESRVSGSETNGGELPNYLFFPSREYGASTSLSLSELTSAWLDVIFGVSEPTLPRVSLKREDIEVARRLTVKLRGDRSRRLVAINFGVGENPLKRVGGEFETSLIARLCEEDSAVILDKGLGAQEAARIDNLIAETTRSESQRRCLRVVNLQEQGPIDQTCATNDVDVLIWNGRVGMLAALIAESDLYIGYDSAGQHIAAALEVPSIDVFAGSSSPRMLDRWKPTSKAETRVIAIDSSAKAPNAEDLTAKVLLSANQMLKKAE
jgi:ADP-heptose:LPS heptosyltransferase